MNISEFFSTYSVESTCRKEFKRLRDREGVICKKCGSEEHYWLRSKEMYQCIHCRFRTSLRSGTIMEASKLPFTYWFAAIYLMCNNKKTLSAYQLQRSLGHKFYEPIWSMMHKIRSAMGARDARYILQGDVEIDEGFFETLIPEEEKEEERKPGRGSQKQTMAMVFAESFKVAPEKTKKHKPGSRCRYFKIQVCPDMKADTVKDLMNQSVALKSRKFTDGFSTYKALAQKMNIIPETTPSDQAHIKLPWVHTAIGNLKRILNGIHHHSKPEYLQNYIDEYCFRLNRRFFRNNLYQRGLIALTLARW